MKKYILPIVILMCLGCAKESAYVLENARIVHVESGETGNYHILIRDSRIEKISEEEIDAPHKIDLTGKYLMPPLWDMHVHLHGNRAKLEGYFKQGVLGVRDLGAFTSTEVDSLINWKQEWENDITSTLPEVVYAGLINNDSTCYHGHRHISTYDDLLASSQYLQEIRSSFYKIHNCFPAELLPQLDSLAEVHQFVFGGHIPEGMDPLNYVRRFKQLNSIEHISVLLRALGAREKNPLNMMEGVTLLDGPYLDSLAIAMKKKGIAYTPNLLSEVEFIKSYPEEQRHLGEALLARFNTYVKRLADHGVTILAGTDNGLESEVDVTLYDELELLTQAGLSNLEVLQAGTINADHSNRRAAFLIKEHARATFIILKENPLEDLSALKSIYGVVQEGTLTAFHNN